MGKRLLSILLTLLILLLGLPITATAATATTVNLSDYAAESGDTVTVSGISEANTWIAVKALDSENGIVVLDFVKSGADGSYSYDLIVPNIADGILRIIAGYETNVAKAELSVGQLYTATVTVYKDGAVWAAGAPAITIGKTSGSAAVNGSEYFNGTYNVYADGTDTGTDITVSEGAATTTVNYYTLTLNAGTGITSVSGAGVYLSGSGVSIDAVVTNGYTWEKWSDDNTIRTRTVTTSGTLSLTASATMTGYTVTYDGNGADSGTAPADSQHYFLGEQVTLMNGGSLVKAGCTFSGWNTQADGGGTAYAAGAAYTMPAADVTLYAIWTGCALSFDGSNDYVLIPDNDAAITDAITIETWVKWESATADAVQFICGKGTEQMELHTGGSVGANGLRFIPAPGVYLDVAGVLPTGEWTHVTVVYQPSAGLAKMFIGGSEVTLTNNGSQPITSALINSATAFYLGCRSDGTYHFKGALDDFRIWNRALTQNEIRLDMLNNPVGTERQTGLLSSYDFNNGIAGADNAGMTTLTDEMDNLNGVLNNFALTGTSSNWVASDAGAAVTSYSIIYDGNGVTSGNTPVDTLRYISGAQAAVKDPGSLTKAGSSFGGWNTRADGAGTIYDADDMITIPGDLTLYAVWIIDLGTVSGVVTDGVAPIEGANVSLTVGGSVYYSATTAADGSYSILNVPVGTDYTVTAGKPGYTSGSATNVSVTANTTTSGVNITLTSDQEGCLVTYKGAQTRYNADSSTYDIRFIAVINTLNAKEVGFVFSKTQEIPNRENASVKATSTVYTEITASGSSVTAASLDGQYIIACTVTGIPESDINVPLHMRAFSTVGTITKYTPVTTVTVADLIN